MEDITSQNHGHLARPLVGAIRCVTMGVTDLAFNLALYRDAMGMVEESRYRLSDSLRRAWNLPDGATGEMVELSHGAYPIGRVRLAHFQGVEQAVVRSHSEDSALDIGPKAIDFYVRHPITTAMAPLSRPAPSWIRPSRRWTA